MDKQQVESKLDKIINKATPSRERRKILKEGIMKVFIEYVEKS